ncbi:IS4 family transposase [Geomesophilobacter sediminis]|uniref:IS4 family transposase n=1 Tax=Geomesophilobacter sediminis TaxID=2798584 RepID=A0A8J7M4M5_9BACT|nr:IS4 family transposase [Geomesophilobacter sediminis]MBJ6728026.1 IS4 family transposase [Geomesophilobacter sediminis]
MQLYSRLGQPRASWAYKKSFNRLYDPVQKYLSAITPLTSRGDRPLQLSFEHQLKALIYFHLQEFSSGRELIQALEQDDFAKECVAPPKGIKKTAFFEAVNNRGLEQLAELFKHLLKDATSVIPAQYADLGTLVAIDGSYIDAVMSMDWADYSSTNKKAKAHVGFDLNRGIPTNMILTDGNEIERHFVERMIGPDETAVLDRGYQCNASFDQWQRNEKKFICRIQARANKKVIRENPVSPDSIVFYDAIVILGARATRAEKEVRVVAYRVDGKDFWIATNRHDLTAEQVAEAYKLRWHIETFFAWWKRHLSVYHLIARTQYGLTVQILGGLITYLLLAIYCQKEHNEPVSIHRVRELRHQMTRDAAAAMASQSPKAVKARSKRNTRLRNKRRKAKT